MSRHYRYFLGADNSGHWYLVDANKRTEFEVWTNLSDDDEAGWTCPEYAERINGSPAQVTFEQPVWPSGPRLPR